MEASYTKTPALESLLNSEYYEIFQRTYFEEHLLTAASENVFIKIIHKDIVTRNNIVWKLACGYCLCNCKTFPLVPNATECTKIFATEKCSTLLLSPKIKYHKIKYYNSKENHQ